MVSFFPIQRTNQPTFFNRQTTRSSAPELLLAGSNLAWQGKPVEGQEDGILTAYEVSNMGICQTRSWWSCPPAKQPSATSGAAKAYTACNATFKIASVTNLVMSLWRVPDKEIVEFMQTFYNNLFVGKSISNAFYQLQNTLKPNTAATPTNGPPGSWFDVP